MHTREEKYPLKYSQLESVEIKSSVNIVSFKKIIESTYQGVMTPSYC